MSTHPYPQTPPFSLAQGLFAHASVHTVLCVFVFMVLVRGHMEAIANFAVRSSAETVKALSDDLVDILYDIIWRRERKDALPKLVSLASAGVHLLKSSILFPRTEKMARRYGKRVRSSFTPG